MDTPTPLTVDLASLQEQLDGFGVVVKLAVASYLDMTVTVAVDGHQVRFTAPERATTTGPAVGASLLIPLSLVSLAEPGSTLVLHAAAPGAFLDLAADLSYALGLDPHALMLDAHLAPPNGSGEGVSSLAEYCTINRAIGVLIERGHTRESAREGLAQYASLDGGELHTAAEQVLRNTDTRLPAVGRNGRDALGGRAFARERTSVGGRPAPARPARCFR